MNLDAVVKISLVIENGESFEDAENRLYDLLFDGLCRNANCEFWVESAEEAER